MSESQPAKAAMARASKRVLKRLRDDQTFRKLWEARRALVSAMDHIDEILRYLPEADMKRKRMSDEQDTRPMQFLVAAELSAQQRFTELPQILRALVIDCVPTLESIYWQSQQELDGGAERTTTEETDDAGHAGGDSGGDGRV